MKLIEDGSELAKVDMLCVFALLSIVAVCTVLVIIIVMDFGILCFVM